jgi:uncharacterized protein YndB with AHSA1/START domain
MSKPEVIYVTYIATTPERLWAALTNPDFTRQYWGGLRIESDWRPGSPVRHLRQDGVVGLQGEVLAADPPHLLSYTFQMQVSEERREPPSRVTFAIDPVGSVVRLTLTHDRFTSESATFENVRHGWPAIIASLKSLLETEKPLPFTGLGFGPSSRGREGTR